MKSYIKKDTFTPIAMKCTEEEFKSIKPILEKFDVVLLDLDGFEECIFLTNYLGGVKNQIENIQITHTRMKQVDFVYEIFNAETFLNACGIFEVEETLQIKKSTILKLAENNSFSEEIIKKEFPQLFEKLTIEQRLERIEKHLGVCN